MTNNDAFNKGQVMAMLDTSVSNNMDISNNSLTCWKYWERDYYPAVIKESYPVYLQERSRDKGKEAFEIIKALQDKKLIKLDKVSDFIDAMDTLIKIL